jgi:lipopolysaccharide transport system permease protein
MIQGMKSDASIVYEPDKFVKAGFFVIWKEMFVNVCQSRELVWRLFLRDFSARYRQSLLGILWAIINPLITVGIFVFLNRSGILNIGETPVPYPVFAMIGISIYGIFSAGLSTCSNSIVGAGPMVVKINFPKISLVVAAMGQALVDFLVRLAVLVVVFVIFGIAPKWTSVFLPFVLLPIILLTLGMGLILSLLAGVFRDAIYLVPIFTTLFLFFVPALYPPPSSGLLFILNQWNPLSHLIIGCRDILISGKIANLFAFAWTSIFSVLIFLVSWRIFFLSEPRIAERV